MYIYCNFIEPNALMLTLFISMNNLNSIQLYLNYNVYMNIYIFIVTS